MFRRPLHILCMPNGKIAAWNSPSILRREMRKARMRKTNKRTHEKWQLGWSSLNDSSMITKEHQRRWSVWWSVETWVHDVPKYVNDLCDHRRAHKLRIIDPFCIAEVIGCFVVQVWMARLLDEEIRRNIAWFDVKEDAIRNKKVTKVSGEKFLNLITKIDMNTAF